PSVRRPDRARRRPCPRDLGPLSLVQRGLDALHGHGRRRRDRARAGGGQLARAGRGHDRGVTGARPNVTDPTDALAERAGRWTAARFTRRSLFGRVGRAAVMLAGGPAIATLLADPASARVCGQPGVSPKFSTYS